MSEPSTDAQSRVPLNLRIPVELRDVIDRTAESAGQTRTDFILGAARGGRSPARPRLARRERRGACRLPRPPRRTARPQRRPASHAAHARALGRRRMTLRAPEPLTAAHAIAGFDCGEESLNDWLRRRALANQARGASRSFVCCDADGTVVGYYALAASSIAASGAPGRMRRNMPDPIPVVVLARLAVDLRARGRQLGRALVRDALLRTLRAAGDIGIKGVIAYALSEPARAFCLRTGFAPSPLAEMTLMATIADLRAVLGEQ